MNVECENINFNFLHIWLKVGDLKTFLDSVDTCFSVLHLGSDTANCFLILGVNITIFYIG